MFAITQQLRQLYHTEKRVSNKHLIICLRGIVAIIGLISTIHGCTLCLRIFERHSPGFFLCNKQIHQLKPHTEATKAIS